jgi:hypothetical protein
MILVAGNPSINGDTFAITGEKAQESANAAAQIPSSTHKESSESLSPSKGSRRMVDLDTVLWDIRSAMAP